MKTRNTTLVPSVIKGSNYRKFSFLQIDEINSILIRYMLKRGISKMKKLTAILTPLLVIGVIILILLSNKAKMEEKARGSFTAYPVSVSALTKQQLSDNLSQVGVINANNDVAIASETQGKVVVVLAKIGSHVSAGAPIIQVDNELPKAKLLATETNYEKIRKDFERSEALHRDGLISDSQYESARLAYKGAEAEYIAAKRQYNNTTITTPISGIVSARPVDIGAMVSPGMPVANVVDISKLKVKLSIAEQDAFRLRVGDLVDVETDVYPGIQFPGRIESISVKADEAHTYPVEISLLNNTKYPLRAGMFGRVNFKMATVNNVLAIPREALIGSIKEPQVYVIEDGKARLRKIVVGAEVGTKLIVLQGLSEGETIVINGQDNLKENVAVNVVSKQ